jgi:hypothetical protein
MRQRRDKPRTSRRLAVHDFDSGFTIEILSLVRHFESESGF